MAILKIENLGVKYDGKPALNNVSFEVPENRITAIIGPSGCGKSTLLKSINGTIRGERGAEIEGKVYLKGQDTSLIPKEELHRRIGLVFQTPTPFPFSIYKNMVYAPKYYGINDKSQLDQIVEEKLKITGLYDEVRTELGKSAINLSGGQQQRLCIARALTVNPEILLLDEPCSALDVQNTAIIESLLKELKNEYTIVIVTHNIPQAQRLADQVVFLDGGNLVECGDADQLFDHPKIKETRDFLSGVFG
ncbi:MAG: phosphate ABC transporter ATP-binding protein [Mogibacterium sp.]|nr:phosphate ABC transporter ATP-binding protein [Mogibacterium sp.]